MGLGGAHAVVVGRGLQIHSKQNNTSKQGILMGAVLTGGHTGHK